MQQILDLGLMQRIDTSLLGEESEDERDPEIREHEHGEQQLCVFGAQGAIEDVQIIDMQQIVLCAHSLPLTMYLPTSAVLGMFSGANMLHQTCELSRPKCACRPKWYMNWAFR